MKNALTELIRFRFELYESFRIAIEQVLQHKVRAMLTALGVMIGVMAVSLMGTAVGGIDKGFEDSLSMFGKDVFYVGRWPWANVGSDWRYYRKRPKFHFETAQRVNEIIAQTPNSALEIAVSRDERHRTVRYKDNTVDGADILGTSYTFTQASPMTLKEGRFFSAHEDESGIRVVVLGYDIADVLFPGVSAIGKKVVIQNQPFEVVGVLERQGDFMGMFSMDSVAILPQKASPSARWDHRDVVVMIKMREGADKNAAYSEIEGAIRQVRGLMPEDNNDFEINRTELIEQQLGPVKQGITIAGLFITGLSLFVGAIGIMNITFVAVRERTKEIGTRRALGAPRRAILTQFLVEAVFICLLGGAVGLGITYLIQLIVKDMIPVFPLVFSWNLMIVAVVASVSVGILSGFAPALSASRMDPAEALRHD